MESYVQYALWPELIAEVLKFRRIFIVCLMHIYRLYNVSTVMNKGKKGLNLAFYQIY